MAKVQASPCGEDGLRVRVCSVRAFLVDRLQSATARRVKSSDRSSEDGILTLRLHGGGGGTGAGQTRGVQTGVREGGRTHSTDWSNGLGKDRGGKGGRGGAFVRLRQNRASCLSTTKTEQNASMSAT